MVAGQLLFEEHRSVGSGQGQMTGVPGWMWADIDKARASSGPSRELEFGQELEARTRADITQERGSVVGEKNQNKLQGTRLSQE